MTGSQLRLVTVPPITDPQWSDDQYPLPPQFRELRPHQAEAVVQIVEHFQRGADVVWLDAPTGTGKSLVGELVRRSLKARAFYVCHSKTLQTQFLRDFGYARKLMGRANYPTAHGPRDVTCDDCPGTGVCAWCPTARECPYQQAKAKALTSPLAVLNMAYFLTEANYVGRVTKYRDLGIIDECDLLEDALMGFIEFRLSGRNAGKVGVEVPKEGSHRTTIGRWFRDELEPRLDRYTEGLDGEDVAEARERKRAERLLMKVRTICGQVKNDEGLSAWVRDVHEGPMVLKPVTVSQWGKMYVWRHAPKWLCMSGTVVSADQLAASTGLTQPWEVVRVPMSFPVENRRIVIAPVADMSRKGKEAGEWDRAITAVRRVCDLHPAERVLVHTVSYELARLTVEGLRRAVGRPVLTYRSAADRDSVLARFRGTERAVLVAPSMDRGVDLADDDCRVVVVMKVPFPYLGDRQISERLRLPGGDAWYAANTVRSLVQMTGRAVRSESDWCVSYILDRQFVRDSKGRGGVMKRHSSLLPAWWKEALVRDFPVKNLVEKEG